MSTTVGTPEPLHEDDAPTAVAPASPRPSKGSDLSLREVGHRIFAFFYHKTVGLALILAMALASLFGTVLPQMPAVYRTDAEGRQLWLDEIRPTWKGLTDPLAAMGMFDVFASWWFIAITILLALSIAACTIHRLPRLWALAMHPKLHVRPSFFEHARLRDQARSTTDVEATVERISGVLGRKGYRVLRADERAGEEGVVSLYADKNRFMPFGTVAAHLAFILVLGGVLLSGAGFRDDVTAPVGTPVEIGHDTGLTLEATSFDNPVDAEMRPLDYVSHIKVSRGGQVVKEADVRVNSPMSIDGVSINQASFGVGVNLVVTDAKGTVIDRPFVTLGDDERTGRTYGVVDLSDDRRIVVDAPSRFYADVPEGSVVVAVGKPGANRVDSEAQLAPGEKLTVGDLTVTFERERMYTGLAVSRDPGAPLVWIASALLMIGTVMTMLLRHRRLWLRVEPDGSQTLTRVGCPDRLDSIYERQFRAMVAELDDTTKEKTDA